MSAIVQRWDISRNNWSRVAWSATFLSLLASLYAPTLKLLVWQWWTDPDYSHGFFVPLFSGYILWRRRHQLAGVEIKPHNSGLLLMITAIGLLLVGSLGAELFTTRLSLLLLVAGMILFLAGWRLLRAVCFPLAFCAFMIPLPAIVYSQITFPLQLFTSRLASSWLEVVRVPVLREGNILLMSNYSLEVVDACSGIRSLMTLLSLAVAFGYLGENRRWARYALALLVVPNAIVTNAIRIVVAGILVHRFGPASAEGFLHFFSAWLIFLTALALLFVSHWLLGQFRRRRDETAYA